MLIDAVKRGRLEYRNSRGRKLKNKYLVIESDDWGSIRQPSIEAWRYQLKNIPETERDPFFYYDALEMNQDMERLFEVLVKYRDCQGNHPIITCDYAVANPDFEKIRKSNFEEYAYEPFTITASAYDGSDNLLQLIREGTSEGIWRPQLHCREHVQISRWMEALRLGDPLIRWAFDNRMISTADVVVPENHYAYMDAFNYRVTDTAIIQTIVEDAVELFASLFGYKSETFVASCYVWNDALEEILSGLGIRWMQGSWYQWIPSETEPGRFIRKKHYNGTNSRYQQYLVRNCIFEHSLFGDDQCVATCLKQIESAFRWNQPAILSSHRVNYMGRLVTANGENGTRLLDELLKEIISRWPGVIFISSDRLINIYSGDE